MEDTLYRGASQIINLKKQETTSSRLDGALAASPDPPPATNPYVQEEGQSRRMT
jgi:hypothetical protein